MSGSDYVTLVGAEDVSRAASNMASAAAEMRSAAAQIEGALFRHQQWADEWLSRLEGIMEAAARPR